MLSQSSPENHPESTGRTNRKVLGLTRELADALRRFDAGALAPEDLRELLRGMTCAASALTRILDQLRESPGLGEHELGPSAHRHLRSELDQAAAAAEDLQVTSESLVRLVPQEVLVPAPARMP